MQLLASSVDGFTLEVVVQYSTKRAKFALDIWVVFDQSEQNNPDGRKAPCNSRHVDLATDIVNPSVSQWISKIQVFKLVGKDWVAILFAHEWKINIPHDTNFCDHVGIQNSRRRSEMR